MIVLLLAVVIVQLAQLRADLAALQKPQPMEPIRFTAKPGFWDIPEIEGPKFP